MSTDSINSKVTESKLHDVLFFVKGVPKELYLHSEEMAIAGIGGIGPKIVAKLGELHRSFDYFHKNRPDLSLSVFIYRGEHPNTNEAIKTAHKRLEGILDVYAQLLDHHVEVSKLALSRQTGESDARIFKFLRGGYAFVRPTLTTGDGQWIARNGLVFANLLSHLDYLSQHPNIPPSDLREDLVYALRMYRQGTKSEFFGLEFLAKFSALECLVCGSATRDKGTLLRSRLALLFAGDQSVTEERIQKLWKLRCKGSHRARVSTERNDSHGMPASVGILHLDDIFAGVLYFALDFAKSCQTVDELWSKAEEYSVPEIVSSGRPMGVTRMAVENMVCDTGRALKGIGGLFDSANAEILKPKRDKTKKKDKRSTKQKRKSP